MPAAMTVRWVLVAALLAALGACPAPAAAAPLHVPKGFVGLNPDGIHLPGVDANRQLDLIRQTGVRSLRVPFYWSAAQPYQDWSDVPASQAANFIGGPVPTDFRATDARVAEAAARHMTVLPVVLDAPVWDTVHAPRSMHTPRDVAPYATYMSLLVQRYGPHGTFWVDNPTVPYLPIRSWQIWNEPNLLPFWSVHPWLSSYIKLLRAAHDAIKAADPGAKVVLAGLDNYSWQYIAWIEHVPGARRLFDVAAVHPYTLTPAGVVTILSRFRAAMDRAGDRGKPILMTEFGWPSALGMTKLLYGFEATRSTQASRLNALMPMLARARARLHLIGFYYYMWMGDEFRGAPSFNYAGLNAYRNGVATAKPAYAVFRHWALAFDRAGG
jgi:hypothetical protein